VKLTPPTTLCPNVRATKDRNVFEVRSRSKEKWWRVDSEAKHGLSECQCPDYQMNKNRECYHIWQVRKFVTIVAMQGSLK
jgi:hypothetical protein